MESSFVKEDVAILACIELVYGIIGMPILILVS